MKQEFKKYTSVGCYPIFYIKKSGFMSDSCLCSDCLNDTEERNYLEVSSADQVIAAINYEDPDLYCDNCSEKIEPAYNEERTELGQ